MPRFVILRHETPPGYERPTHFDLMLEWDDALRTWSLASFPQVGESIAAEELAPHRREYLDYQGEVSGGRGTVTQAAVGEYELIEISSLLVWVKLDGPELAGSLRLVRRSVDAALWSATLFAQ